jgi:hypothetical protein
MSTRLSGKVAVVFGAGSSGAALRNGRAAAFAFAREGALTRRPQWAEGRLTAKEMPARAAPPQFTADVTCRTTSAPKSTAACRRAQHDHQRHPRGPDCAARRAPPQHRRHRVDRPARHHRRNVTIDDEATSGTGWRSAPRPNPSISRSSNIQDNSVVHTDPGAPAFIGVNVSIEHGAPFCTAAPSKTVR